MAKSIADSCKNDFDHLPDEGGHPADQHYSEDKK